MASGLANDHAEDDPLTDLGYLYFGTDSPWIVGRVRAHEPPGTRFDYNSINTQALATILERATGRRYAELLSEKLWRPIGAGEAAVWLDHAGGAAKGFCCLFATARDWARVGLLVLNRGRCGDRQVVPAAWIDEMSRSSPLERDYGLHLWLGRGGARREDHREPFEADDVVWLDGRHKQRVYVVPSRELVVVRVGERARKWDEAVLVNTLVRGMRR
jgi:CubicO group peptidase (beta-lactamase class C family)